MTWWQTIPTFAAATLLYFLPGFAILAGAGVRRLNLAALSAPVSASIAACTAVVAPFLHLPFNPTVFFAVSAVLALGTYLVRLRWLRRSGNSQGGLGTASKTGGHLAANGPILPSGLGRITALLSVPVGMLFAAAIITTRYVSGIGSPENFSQTFDNIYHLNAVQHIAQFQNGSSLTLGNLTAGSQGFYPAGMHDMMALLQMVTGTPIPVAVNVGTIVIGAIIWPLSCMFMISRIVGYRPIPLLVTGALAGSFSAFPYLMVAFGVLYPFHAAIALLPVALGLAAELLGVSKAKPSSPWAPAWALVAILPGIVLIHPSVFVALLGFTAPVVLAMLIRSVVGFRKRHITGKALGIWIAISTAYAGATLLAWVLLRPGLGAAPWTPFQSNARAIGEILSSAPMGTTVAWILLPLTVIGLYVVSRQWRQRWWILGIYAVGGLLYLVVSSWGPGFFRTFLTGVWYNDSFRLAALLPTVTLPVIVLGAEWVLWRIRSLVDLLLSRKMVLGADSKGLPNLTLRLLPSISGILVVWLTIFGMGVLAQGGTLSSVQDRLGNIFAVTPTSDLVTTNELALIKEVPDSVPAGGVIVANPLTGGSLVYALANRESLAPHVFGERTPKEQYLIDHWDEAAYNKAVCPIIKELNAYWALNFGNQTVIPAEDPFPGLDSLIAGTTPGIDIVAQVGDVQLVRTTVCG